MKYTIILVCLLILNLSANIFPQTSSSNCICPDIKMIEPDRILGAGEPVVFKAEIKGDKAQTTYNWTVSAGTIIEGQGTPTIKVDTADLWGVTITATVQVGGWCPTCENLNVSGVVNIPERISGDFDEFVLRNCEELLARLDSFYNQLNNQPATTGYIRIRGKSHQTNRAERQIRNAIKFRHFDPSRIVTFKGSGETEKAEIAMFLVPLGAEPPKSDSPTIAVEEETQPIKLTKPYIFSSEYYDGIGGCETPLDLEGFADALKENPRSRGNIVIMLLSKSEFRKKEREILNFLTSKGIARKRLKTFYVNSFGGVELWHLP